MRIPTPLRVTLAVVAAFLVAALGLLAILIFRFEPIAREYVIEALEKRYQGDVTLGKLEFAFVPRVRATGEDLTLRFHGQKDGPPLFKVRRFTIEAPLVNFFRSPRHIDRVVLEGLELHIPPGGRVSGGGSGNGTSSNISFVLDDVVADGTTLETLPADPKKLPLRFDITKLHLHSIGRDMPMTFQAELINAKPPGLIHTEGNFGPWAANRPGETALAGKYTFRDADLSVFKGITGKLNSDGAYRGKLASIDVSGTADVPAFALTLGGRAMPLHTEFAATVDGTNGDTVLHPVHAKLGNSLFDVSGSIEHGALEHHKEIDLQTSSNASRIEDFLKLTVNGTNPALTGGLRFQSSVKIPPGETPVITRIQLAGTFGMSGVLLTNPEFESKIATISHYGLGNPKDPSTSVPASFEGRFQLSGGTLTLPRFQFAVPGADIELAGNYTLPMGAINFSGHARLQAKASQMTTGVKSLLLRPVDRLLARDGAGVDVPINITGTRENPSFKVDFRAILRRL